MKVFIKKIKYLFENKPFILTWAIVGLVSLVLVFAYFSFFRPSLISIGQRITSLHLEIAENSKNRIEGFLNENINGLDQLSQALSVVDDLSKQKTIIAKFIKDNNWFTDISVIDSSGRETLKLSQYDYIGPNDLSDVSQYEYFIDAANGRNFMSQVYTNDKAVPLVTISLPIRDNINDINGVLSAQLSLRKIWEIISDIQVGNGGQVYLVDSLGYIIAHPDISLILNKTNVASRSAVEQVISQKQMVLGLDSNEEYVNEAGRLVYVVGLPLSGQGWGVFVEDPVNDAWASYQKIRATGIVLGFVTFIMVLFLVINAQVLNNLFRDLRKGRQLLTVEIDKRTNELVELDRTTKLLVRRDLELSVTNRELDKKIEQQENSEKSLLRAFSDIQTAHRDVEEEKNKTEAIINNFIDPIIVLDDAKRISLFNPAARRIFGMTDKDLGKKVDDKDDYSIENFKELIGKVFTVKKLKYTESDQGMIEEVEFKQGEENIYYKVVTADVRSSQGDYLGIMKIFYDVTREKMIDKLKSEFISIAAHQLRTPLSAIKWVIKMVLDEDVGKLNAEQLDLLSKGYKSNERIIRLVNDLLNVSRIEEGRFGYVFEKQDIMTIINPVVEGVESLIDKNHVKFKINKPAKLPLVIFDKDKLTLVIQNLLDNAVKYTPEYGKIEINITETGKFLRIAVKDNGVGIPEKDKAKLFSKFFRATNVIRMQTEGSGLGLFIVKNIVEKHGGTIAIDSKEGVGTEFSFKLPIA